MKLLFAIGALGLLAFVGWQLGGVLSSDAFGLALGVMLGLMAGIPAALMATANTERSPQPPQKTTERISSTPVPISSRITVLSNPGVALLAQEARKRLEAK